MSGAYENISWVGTRRMISRFNSTWRDADVLLRVVS